jgi:uncharacterized protein YerC
MPRTILSIDEKQHIRKLYDEGMKRKEIREATGYSVYHVNRAIRDLDRIVGQEDLQPEDLSSEEQQHILRLYFDEGRTAYAIKQVTGYTIKQIGRVTRSDSANKRQAQHRQEWYLPKILLYQEQKEKLIQFICASKTNRRMNFLDLSLIIFNGQYTAYTLKEYLRQLGFNRRIAHKKHTISEANRVKRLAWAQEHLNWTLEQWGKILWTDETWITGGPRQKQYVTRKDSEEWHDDCLVERYQKEGGWMFWGCFSALGKGPSLFWGKDWGPVSEETYQQHTIPIIDDWVRYCKQTLKENLILMQDEAHSHSAADDLRERGVTIANLPPCSPDLSLMYNCFNWTRGYIEDKWGLEEKLSYERLRQYSIEAWDRLPDSYLQELLSSMKDRCAAVIAANGMHTNY